VLDWGNCANITIIIAAATVAAVVSGTIITGEAITVVDSIIIFRSPPSSSSSSSSDDPVHEKLLAIMPFLGHIIIVIFIFQYTVKEELEVLAVGQGLIVI
jgi:hypothetical protein